MEILTVTLNDTCFGIPVKDVEFVQLLDKTASEDAPIASSHIARYIVLRGTSVQVCCLASLFGFPVQKSRHLVVVNVDGAKLALEVDSADTIINVKEENIFPAPPCTNIPQSYLQNVVVYHQEQLIFLINVNRLVSV